MADNVVLFNSGVEEVSIQGDPSRTLRWVPSDPNFVDRYWRFMEFIKSDFSERVKAQAEKAQAAMSTGEYEAGGFEALSAEFCAQFDALFGQGASIVVFDIASPMTPTGTGEFVFGNFLGVMAPRIESSIKQQSKAREKYLAPHRKKS